MIYKIYCDAEKIVPKDVIVIFYSIFTLIWTNLKKQKTKNETFFFRAWRFYLHTSETLTNMNRDTQNTT